MHSVKTHEGSARNGFNPESRHSPATPNPSPIEIHFEEIDGFEWSDEFEQILTCLARTGLPPPSSPPWPTILKAMLYSLKVTVQSYFKLGSGSLFDTREEPAGGWLWTSEDLQRSIDRVYLSLKDFSDHEPNTSEYCSNSEQHEQINSIRSAPFTIQRLAELMFPQSTTPSGTHPHYTTLPKYLRAIQRVLSVSSPVTSYAVNTFMLSHPTEFITTSTLSGPSSHQSTSTRVNGESISTTFPPSSLRPRRHSTSTTITPTLSPIPWLVNSERHDSLSPELACSEGRHSRHLSPLLLSSGSDERPITPPLMSSSPPAIFTTTPPQTLPSNLSPRRGNHIISPTPIDRTSPSRVDIITTLETESPDQPTGSPETPVPSLIDTHMSNGVVPNQDPSHNQSEDSTMDETA